MKKILIAFTMLLAVTACTNKTATVVNNNAEDSSEVAFEAAFEEIDRYLADSIGSQYSKGEYCVPIHSIVGVDERNTDNILVWGSFWVFNYNQVGDTLKCVSGGSHPGLMHLRQTEQGFQVTAFDQVEDGSSYLPSAKKIFGDKFDAFQAVNSDEQTREKLRADVLAAYVKKHGLTATLYQDFGWPAKTLGE